MSRSREPRRPPLCTSPVTHSASAEDINGQNLLSGCVFTDSGGYRSRRSAVLLCIYPLGKKVGTLFAQTGSKLRCSRAIVSAGRDGYIGKGGAPRSESIIAMIAGGNHTTIHRL